MARVLRRPPSDAQRMTDLERQIVALRSALNTLDSRLRAVEETLQDRDSAAGE